MTARVVRAEISIDVRDPTVLLSTGPRKGILFFLSNPPLPCALLSCARQNREPSVHT